MPKPPIAEPPTPKECIICYFPTINNRIYCERCRSHVQSHKMDKLKRRRALIAAIDRPRNVFLCQYARLPVELVDRSSHKWIQFDHITPIKLSEFQVTWAVFNQMKGDNSDSMFTTVVRRLDGGGFITNKEEPSPAQRHILAVVPFKGIVKLLHLEIGP